MIMKNNPNNAIMLLRDILHQIKGITTTSADIQKHELSIKLIEIVILLCEFREYMDKSASAG